MSVFIWIIFILLQGSTSYSDNLKDIQDNKTAITKKMASSLYACDFEVFGKVQGVFFRKHTEKQANNLGLKGWCMNTYNGTVKGQIEGSKDKIQEMQKWLQHTGSPSSKIERAVFSEIKQIPKGTFANFAIRR